MAAAREDSPLSDSSFWVVDSPATPSQANTNEPQLETLAMPTSPEQPLLQSSPSPSFLAPAPAAVPAPPPASAAAAVAHSSGSEFGSVSGLSSQGSFGSFVRVGPPPLSSHGRQPLAWLGPHYETNPQNLPEGEASASVSFSSLSFPASGRSSASWELMHADVALASSHDLHVRGLPGQALVAGSGEGLQAQGLGHRAMGGFSEDDNGDDGGSFFGSEERTSIDSLTDEEAEEQRAVDDVAFGGWLESLLGLERSELPSSSALIPSRSGESVDSHSFFPRQESAASPSGLGDEVAAGDGSLESGDSIRQSLQPAMSTPIGLDRVFLDEGRPLDEATMRSTDVPEGSAASFSSQVQRIWTSFVNGAGGSSGVWSVVVVTAILGAVVLWRQWRRVTDESKMLRARLLAREQTIWELSSEVQNLKRAILHPSSRGRVRIPVLVVSH